MRQGIRNSQHLFAVTADGPIGFHTKIRVNSTGPAKGAFKTLFVCTTIQFPSLARKMSAVLAHYG